MECLTLWLCLQHFSVEPDTSFVYLKHLWCPPHTECVPDTFYCLPNTSVVSLILLCCSWYVCNVLNMFMASITMQYGLRWIESSSQRWSPVSRWNHLLASYVTPTGWSNAFCKLLKVLNLEKSEKNLFYKCLFPLLSMLSTLKRLKNALDH